MTITISAKAYWELCQEVNATPQSNDPDDELDVTWKYPQTLGEGHNRIVQLRENLVLDIHSYQHHDNLIIQTIDRPYSLLEFRFVLSGQLKETRKNSDLEVYQTKAGQCDVCGSGMAVGAEFECSKEQQVSLGVHLTPEVLQSFIGNSSMELPPELQHLIRSPEQPLHSRSNLIITPVMQYNVQRILHCPYQGIIKRTYLEGKVLELLALVLEQEAEIQMGSRTQKPLKPGTLERILYARDLLLQQFHNPPSTAELARLVKLNEYTLKRGFLQVFGKPLFAYLHDYRLEQARQLLETGEMKVTEVAQKIGFASRNHFAAAFRKKFGINPKEYLMQRKHFF
ncbi:MAG: AraC family transcriptional regulator [Desmonostoc geniculatum HA4340-LM1]|jgi:AraC-like DNA-binding protein|nr:AraC family transcriptional regulator [Goleter apudmare HA4340-LM2]MBW4678303.1 AraC family transcriptional regulator [Desmonostoc geniculatum HA4340-LM1]